VTLHFESAVHYQTGDRFVQAAVELLDGGAVGADQIVSVAAIGLLHDVAASIVTQVEMRDYLRSFQRGQATVEGREVGPYLQAGAQLLGGEGRFIKQCGEHGFL
jgi:hypothetical protein